MLHNAAHEDCPHMKEFIYSLRSAVIGLILRASIAGMSHAASDAAPTAATTPANAIGSRAVTPKSSPLTACLRSSSRSERRKSAFASRSACIGDG